MRTAGFSISFLTLISAHAFPTGSFECGEGQTTSRIEIEKVAVGLVDLPRLTVTLRRPDLESTLSGMGLIVTIKDKKTSELERRLLLPGSNVDLKFTDAGELELLSSPKRCLRRS